MAAQLELDIADRDGNSRTLLQIFEEKIPASRVDRGATVSELPGLMILVGPAESLKGKEKCYSREHRGGNPPLKFGPAILRDKVSYETIFHLNSPRQALKCLYRNCDSTIKVSEAHVGQLFSTEDCTEGQLGYTANG